MERELTIGPVVLGKNVGVRCIVHRVARILQQEDSGNDEDRQRRPVLSLVEKEHEDRDDAAQERTVHRVQPPNLGDDMVVDAAKRRDEIPQVVHRGYLVAGRSSG